tara:strand:- start:539 stop:808 length:270 start_codon:yes stop_codon:yes gene_type:complete
MKKETKVVQNELFTESWGQTTILRNNQVIHTVNIDGMKSSMARTSTDMWYKIKDIRSQISTVSRQDNEIDLVMGIGENKTNIMVKYPRN